MEAEGKNSNFKTAEKKTNVWDKHGRQLEQKRLSIRAGERHRGTGDDIYDNQDTNKDAAERVGGMEREMMPGRKTRNRNRWKNLS